jgi:hypothetical protein
MLSEQSDLTAVTAILSYSMKDVLQIPSKWYISRSIAHLRRYFTKYSIQEMQNEPQK